MMRYMYTHITLVQPIPTYWCTNDIMGEHDDNQM